MEPAVIAAVVVAILAMFIIARKVLGIAFKLLLVGSLVVALLLAISLAWWSISSTHRKRARTPARTSPTRSTNSH